MGDSEINNIILKIYEEQKKTNKKLGGLEGKVDGLENKVAGLESKVDGLEGKVDGLEGKVDGLESKVDGLQEQLTEIQTKEIPSIKEELRKISGTVAIIEHDHGEKLQILFDAVTGNRQKSEELEKIVEKHEKIINKHSDEIYYLKESVQDT